MNNLITISNVRGYIDSNGIAQLNLEDVARGLGFTEAKGNYIRWQRVLGHLESFGFSTSGEKPEFIPENIFYRLAMKANNATAETFQILVCDEILPNIRKTGAYSVHQGVSQVETNAISKKYAFDMSLAGTKFAIEMLRPSQASQIRMIETVHKSYGLPTNFLPSYTEEEVTKSATELLEAMGKPISARTLNGRLLALGLLEVKTRNGKGGAKKEFKSLTDAGLYYGKNLLCHGNERETQPHFYEAKFPELIRRVIA